MQKPLRVAVFFVSVLALSILAVGADSQRWQTLYDAGRKYRDEGRVLDALNAFTAAMTEALLPGGSIEEQSKTLDGLGDVYLARYQYVEAGEALKRSLAIYDKAGKEDDKSANCAWQLAFAYTKQKRFQEAEPLARRCLSFARSHNPALSRQLFPCLDFCAYACWNAGNFKEAEKLLEEQMQICRQRPFPKNGDELTRTLQSLAEMNAARGDYARAEPLFKRAIYLREEVFPPAEFGVTEILSSYMEMLQKAGRKADAEHIKARLDTIDETHHNTTWSGIDPEGKDVMKYMDPALREAPPIKVSPQQ